MIQIECQCEKLSDGSEVYSTVISDGENAVKIPLLAFNDLDANIQTDNIAYAIRPVCCDQIITRKL
jgi:hypothetical protein